MYDNVLYLILERTNMPKPEEALETASQASTAQAAEAEVQAPWIGRHNYTLNSSTVLSDVYRLLTVVFADRAIAAVCQSERDELAQMRDQFIEDELVHLLIATAAMNRTHHDHMGGPRSDETELGFELVEHHCGLLVPDVSVDPPREEPLIFREACNKIIHATQIVVETEEVDQLPYPVALATVTLRGTRAGTPWQARLDVPEYARATWMNFS
jgi:hypothetical protein